MAALDLGVTPRGVRERVKNSGRLQGAIAETHETILDLSETALVQAIIEKDGAMVRFHLDRKGRHRGYGLRSELSGPNGGPLQMAVQPVLDFEAMPDDERELLRVLLERQRARMLGTGE